MVSPFRKIHQKLLGQHRVMQFFAYAVGEIFLVVIGILIARQLNTENEEREKRDYELKSTLEKDRRYFRSQVRNLATKEASAKSLLKKIQSPEANLEHKNIHLEQSEIDAYFQCNSGA